MSLLAAAAAITLEENVRRETASLTLVSHARLHSGLRSKNRTRRMRAQAARNHTSSSTKAGRRHRNHTRSGAKVRRLRNYTFADKVSNYSSSRSSRSSRLERSVAFFGAVDSRPLLFLQVVALQSVRRYHPSSGFFVMMPEARVANWSTLLGLWSANSVKPLALRAETARQQFIMASSGYSAMTFHRHHVPEMLNERGYRFGINLDPDVVCSRPWDLRILTRVKLLGGRPVGTNARTATWLQTLQNESSGHAGNTQENVTSILYRELGLTPERLQATKELNGGVLVFNNSEAARVGWGGVLARYHAKLRTIVEGDQDLIGLLLAAEPTFQRYYLPTTYNYAYRRDRERLPYAIAHRLRHGLVEQQIVNVHFVVDGKPWQRQTLAAYPLWLLTARLHHLKDWLSLARATRPRLLSQTVQLSASEREMLGAPAFEAMRHGASRNGTLKALVDGSSHRRCRCFIRSLSQDKKSDPLELLIGTTKLPKDVAEAAQNIVRKQRQTMLSACGGHRKDQVDADERRLCEVELGARAALFKCALAAARAGQAVHRSAAGASGECHKDALAANDLIAEMDRRNGGTTASPGATVTAADRARFDEA